MHHDVAKIHYQPSVACQPFLAAFSLVRFTRALEHRVRQRIQHAIAGAIDHHEVISEAADAFQVQQDDVFALLVFEGVDDEAGQFERVQAAILCGPAARAAEKRRVYTEPSGCRSLLIR